MTDPTEHLPVADGGDAPPPANRLLRIADSVFAVIAGLTLLGMVLMTTVDVVGRYLFAAPLGFAFEMTQMAMAAVVFAALPSVTLRSQHVTVGLFENTFTGLARRMRDALIALVIAACFAYLAWRLSTLAGRFVSYGDMTSVLHFPIGIVAWLGVAGSVMSAIAALILAVRAIMTDEQATKA